LLSPPALCASLPVFGDGPKAPRIGAAMQEMIAQKQIAGAVTRCRQEI